MSTKAVAWALEQTVSSPTAKLVLVGLAEHADPQTWIAWPSRATCALYAGCSPRSVTRHFQSIVKEGFVEEVTPAELDDVTAERFESLPADRRPRLWIVNPTGSQTVHPRVDKSSRAGGQTGGHSSVHQTKRKPLHKTAGSQISERRDYLDADSTAALLDEYGTPEPDESVTRLRAIRGKAS